MASRIDIPAAYSDRYVINNRTRIIFIRTSWKRKAAKNFDIFTRQRRRIWCACKWAKVDVISAFQRPLTRSRCYCWRCWNRKWSLCRAVINRIARESCTPTRRLAVSDGRRSCINRDPFVTNTRFRNFVYQFMLPDLVLGISDDVFVLGKCVIFRNRKF